MSSALMLSDDLKTGTLLKRVDLRRGMAEHWLRDRLFDHPELIPMDEIDPGAGQMIPVAREFPLPRSGGTVYVDLFGVTPAGRPVLVECKLWRNPQARREVVAQLIEYAALFRRLSYADLTSVLRGKYGMQGENPLHDLVSGASNAVGEGVFCDRVSRCLETGDIELIIAGDGIRESMSAIAGHLAGQGARLTLLELQMWEGPDNRRLLVPQVPFRTEVLRQRILVDETDRPIAVEEPDADDLPSVPGAGGGSRAANRAFWDTFIHAAAFDHPDQPKPAHGGNNWVRIRLPAPARWLTGYRTAQEIGFFLVQDKDADLSDLLAEAGLLEEETGLPTLIVEAGERAGEVVLRIARPLAEVGGEEAQIAWLVDVANRLVNALRPRLSQLGAAG